MHTTRKSWSDRVADLAIYSAMWGVIAITLYPFLYIISMSLSEPIHVVEQSVWLFPKGFSLEAYARVFDNEQVWKSYYNTVFYTAAGTALNVAMTTLAAYPLARRSFSLRRPIMVFIVITMFFGGGIIPTFILIQELGIYNTRWAILLPSAVSAFLIIIARTFFQTIPESLHESAKLDGANDLAILYRIVLPLSQPILAVLTLFYAVNHWNSFFPAMMYLPDKALQPLSLYLIKILVQNQEIMVEGVLDSYDRTLYAVQLKYALIVITVLPIMAVYPFLQKYFVQGVMIGSLKE
ncbi:carbohydrate ABC transporter permease [Paenibacillus koleovorans]|uniref:carbohydrate ABC transporter permease n=1 Tax=Paenibacillus koleovorans TaxID=121608 RepID=UPI000FD76FF0|nr:carbohydrate ABC transporter permease [Paenibacillus koleovorans]